MGCFSFMCKVCNEPINSDSAQGQEVALYLLKDGKEIDSMRGEYDSYGRVFVDEPYIEGELRKSLHWKLPWSGANENSDSCCSLMFSSNIGDGIAAVHKKCFIGGMILTPTTQSDNDPNQGWGDI